MSVPKRQTGASRLLDSLQWSDLGMDAQIMIQSIVYGLSFAKIEYSQWSDVAMDAASK